MIGSSLQKAIYQALRFARICDGRIYDRVPAEPTFPYVTIGDEQVLDDSNACGEAYEVFADIHVWSRPKSGSKSELKELLASVTRTLRTMTAVPGFALVLVRPESSRSMRDPDGLTEHGVLTFQFLLDPIE